jgi:hypothetical protein
VKYGITINIIFIRQKKDHAIDSVSLFYFHREHISSPVRGAERTRVTGAPYCRIYFRWTTPKARPVHAVVGRL